MHAVEYVLHDWLHCDTHVVSEPHSQSQIVLHLSAEEPLQSDAHCGAGPCTPESALHPTLSVHCWHAAEYVGHD